MAKRQLCENSYLEIGKQKQIVSDVQQALYRLRNARSRDEADAYAGELALAARKNVNEVVDLFYATETDTFSLVWCLHGLTSDPVIDLFKHALKHKDPYVRWAALEGLKYSSQPSLIPVFIDALKDRSHSVKGVAVDWLRLHGDSRAIDPLQRLSKLPSLIRTSPGTVERAKDAVSYLSSKGRTLVFREATSDDIPALSAVRLAVKENALSHPGRITTPMYEEHLSEIGRGWLCEVDGQVVGFSVASLRDALIWALFVTPDHEGKGIGKRLLCFATEWLFANGTEQIVLKTAVGTRADLWYEKQGWTRGAIEPDQQVHYTLSKPR